MISKASLKILEVQKCMNEEVNSGSRKRRWELLIVRVQLRMGSYALTVITMIILSHGIVPENTVIFHIFY
jgi:hypothetical protein